MINIYKKNRDVDDKSGIAFSVELMTLTRFVIVSSQLECLLRATQHIGASTADHYNRSRENKMNRSGRAKGEINIGHDSGLIEYDQMIEGSL